MSGEMSAEALSQAERAAAIKRLTSEATPAVVDDEED
jgi:hypothetical protein